MTEHMHVYMYARTLAFRLWTVASKFALSTFNCSHSLQRKSVMNIREIYPTTPQSKSCGEIKQKEIRQDEIN